MRRDQTINERSSRRIFGLVAELELFEGTMFFVFLAGLAEPRRAQMGGRSERFCP